jgi:hypothetical protein
MTLANPIHPTQAVISVAWTSCLMASLGPVSALGLVDWDISPLLTASGPSVPR